MEILSNLGIAVSMSKAVEHGTRITFLSIITDGINLTHELDPNRLSEVDLDLLIWNSKKSAKVKQVQRLVSLLNICAIGVKEVKLFFARVLDILKTVTQNINNVIPL